jgi:hypothetical protein
MAVIKKKMQMGGKAKATPAPKGKPMGPEIGAYSKLRGKDLELEKKTNLKFGDGPGSGPSGAMPQPKKKMGGKVVKKAKNGFDLNNDGKTTFKDVLIGRGVLPKTAKKGASMKKCKYGCK